MRTGFFFFHGRICEIFYVIASSHSDDSKDFQILGSRDFIQTRELRDRTFETIKLDVSSRIASSRNSMLSPQFRFSLLESRGIDRALLLPSFSLFDRSVNTSGSARRIAQKRAAVLF